MVKSKNQNIVVKSQMKREINGTNPHPWRLSQPDLTLRLIINNTVATSDPRSCRLFPFDTASSSRIAVATSETTRLHRISLTSPCTTRKALRRYPHLLCPQSVIRLRRWKGSRQPTEPSCSPRCTRSADSRSYN